MKNQLEEKNSEHSVFRCPSCKKYIVERIYVGHYERDAENRMVMQFICMACEKAYNIKFRTEDAEIVKV